MGKITPRSFLILIIYGLVFLSGNTAFANINYGPEKPDLREKQQKNLFFVGFYLDEVPTIIAPANKPIDNDPGQCYASNVNLGTPTITGTSNSPEISVDGININPVNYQFPIGPTTVTWTITNNDGTDSDTQIITVTDNEQPVISHNEDQNLNNVPGTCGASFTPIASATDNCSVGTPTGTRSDGLALTAAYPVGTTTITWNVTDANTNNAAPVTQTITVTDNEKPVITHNGDQNLNNDPGTCRASFTPTASATDNCSVGNPTGTRSDGLALTAAYPVGTTTITWNVSDENTNNADPVTQTITVTDNEKPVITHNGDQNLNNDPGTCGASFTPTVSATDNCSVGNPTGTRSDGLALTAAYPVGTTTITWNVTDGNTNNAAPVTQTITVTDNEKPVLPAVNDITWGCAYTVQPPVAIDNCDGEIIGTPNRSTTFTESGTIIWTFTDASGNSDSLQQTITINPLVAEIETTDISCFGFNNGSAVVTANGGVGNLIYNWGSLSGSGNSKDNLAPGNYMVSVSDQNGCSIELPFTISQPDNLQMTTNPTSTPVSCFGGNDGSITAGAISGGTPDQNGNYQYSIDNENWNTTGEFSGVEAGSYTIFVVDDKGCALQVPINLEEPDVLNATLNKTDVNCFQGNDGTVYLNNVSGGIGEVFFRIVGTVDWTESTESITNLQAGTYQIEIKDENDCIEELTNTIQIQQPDSHISVSLPENIRTQQYGTTTASVIPTVSGGTPNYTYEWIKINEDGSQGEVLQTSQRANSLPAGNYQLVVTDANSCVSEPAEFEVIEEVDAYILESSYCASNNDDIRTSEFFIDIESMRGGIGDPENFIYSWDFGSGATPQSADNKQFHDDITVKYNNPGTKTIKLWVTDESGVISEHNFSHYVGECFEPCGNAQDIQFNIENFFFGYDYNGNPNIDRSVIEIEECDENANVFLYIDITKISQMHSLSAEIKYTIESDGEITSYEILGTYDGDDVEEGLFPIFKVGPGEDQIKWECGDELSITFANFSWTKGNGNGGGRGNGNNGGPHCLGFNTDISVPTPLTASAVANDALCFNNASGSININARGGTRPYEYSIDGASYQLDNSFLNLSAGTYNNVTVRDSDEKTLTLDPLIIGEPEQISIENVHFEDISCFGLTTSARVVNPIKGTPFIDENGNEYYEYLWSNGQTGQEVTDLSGGEYTVTIIDANGCDIVENFIIDEPEELTADAGENQEFNCGFTTAIISANIPEIGTGKWSIAEGTGGSFEDENEPNTTFTGEANTNYILEWIITPADDTCPAIDSIGINFSEDCTKLDFDGVDDHVNLGDNYGLTSGNFSIEAWIRLKSVNNTRTIFSKRNSKELSTGFDLIINSGAPTFRWGNNSVSTSHKVTADRWHHIAAIYNSGNISLYVDGIRVGNATATYPAVVNAPALIGAMYNADTELPVNYFHGWIEEVRLWGTALSEEQLRFMMNQRLIVNQNPVRGDVLPLDVPGNLGWDNLKAYLQMKVTESGNGTTPNLVTNSVDGELKNIETNQENTAPLPYESAQGGTWHNRNSWDSNSTKFWTYPNDTGINGTTIEWNIAKQNHDIDSNNKDIKLLGLFSKTGTQLTMEGVNNNSGNELRITHYLELDGFIDLDGESQLVQTEGSILADNSSGIIERDQQGTENSFNYNYWTSPASPKGTNNNSNFTVKGVMKDGTSTKNPQDISFAYAHTHADGNYTGNKRVSTYWLHKFHGDANSYGHWRWIGHTGALKTGEGFTMKGTSGSAPITSLQNYVFHGKPHNGTISLNILNQENRLVGNPYPSAIDADQFIRDNLKDVDGGTRNKNVFNGALYFWDHFGQENSHVLREYVGGYATYSLAGGVKAASTDSRINNTTNETGSKTPGRYIPVAQGFFVNSVIDDAISGSYSIDGGDITFRNRQRVFVKESSANSQFLKPENFEKGKSQVTQAKYTEDTRYKIRLNFHSPKGYHREILVTADSKTTNQFDLGYDAPLIDNNVEDMYWMMEKSQFVIQAVPHFNLDQKLPIGLKIAEEKEFSIKIGELENVPEIIDIYLRDNTDSTYHDLRKEAFKATLPAGEYQDLYEIVFHDETSTGKDKEPGEGPIDYYYSLDNREFVINNPELHKIEHMDIYNIAGQLVDQHFGIPDVKEIHIPQKKSLSSAVYIVKVYTSSGDYAKKVIIRKD